MIKEFYTNEVFIRFFKKEVGNYKIEIILEKNQYLPNSRLPATLILEHMLNSEQDELPQFKQNKNFSSISAKHSSLVLRALEKKYLPFRVDSV